MPRNVEIKAKVTNVEFVVRIAKELSSSDGEILKQHDVFFNVPNGRLKLRYLQGKDAELLFYDRQDTLGPKISAYKKVTVPDGNQLESLLTSALGTKGSVKKTRQLFLVGQTRVHIDNVDNLGDYMELEVMLDDSQTLEDGQIIADSLMSKLGVNKDDLVCGAYLDLLNNRAKW